MYHNVLKFWFKELSPQQWWEKDNTLDKCIQDRFAGIHLQASHCELYQWRKSAKGRLAEIIVLDQFSRNMFRDTAKSFAQDSLALSLSQQAIAIGADKELNAIERSFLYMPFMHSESLLIHQQACLLYKKNGIDNNYQFELKHLEIIEKFGRYPHRNNILNRQSSTEESDFLSQPNSSF
ncbi:MAG: hypothetical protein COA59_05500 [Colwellia sp.]|nr:MAG: hypothetical protein COA59_05500 [Colwellia sp.]